MSTVLQVQFEVKCGLFAVLSALCFQDSPNWIGGRFLWVNAVTERLRVAATSLSPHSAGFRANFVPAWCCHMAVLQDRAGAVVRFVEMSWAEVNWSGARFLWRNAVTEDCKCDRHVRVTPLKSVPTYVVYYWANWHRTFCLFMMRTIQEKPIHTNTGTMSHP